MPTVVENVVDGYASCRDGTCPGYKQQPVKVVVTETQFTYVDLGGDIPGVERSCLIYGWENPDDEPCPVCGQPRLCSDQVRPVYPNISGQPQDALLAVGRDSDRVRDLMLENAKRDAEMAQMTALMERMAANAERQERQIEALTSDLASRPRGPGRPRKVEE
jgi:hypothetical protein